MQPWGKVSSFRGANTLFEGQQIHGHGQIKRGHREKRDREKRREERIHIEERHRREDKDRRDTQQREERSKTQIKEDPSNRFKEEPGPLRDITSEGHNT
jgi:hypothetical protein